MPKYNVHTFITVHILTPNIEAGSPHQAAQKAEEKINPHEILQHIPNVEYAEEITGATIDLLDDQGEIIYEQATHLDYSTKS